MVGYLARDGIPISRDRVRNLMRRMGLRAIYQKPRTTVPGAPSERFPCLVDVSTITAVDQVWATDITYIPLQCQATLKTEPQATSKSEPPLAR